MPLGTGCDRKPYQLSTLPCLRPKAESSPGSRSVGSLGQLMLVSRTLHSVSSCGEQRAAWMAKELVPNAELEKESTG